MKRLKLSILLGIYVFSFLKAQENVNNIQLNNAQPAYRTTIQIPDVGEFKVLKGDFHMHTIFSDGNVWPTVRVQEAWREGLDVISITDHIEYLPHQEYLKMDHNTSYNLAKEEARKHNLLLVKGTEITRNMPPGHINAFYIADANRIDIKKPELAFDMVKEQNGLMIWNHPGWKAQQPDTCLIYDIHKKLIQERQLHGMEVANHTEWYPIVLQWCIDNKLAVFANSDSHQPVAYSFDLKNNHRPMTLFLTREHSLEGVRQAIESARTIAWFDKQLAGPEKLLKQLYEACVKVKRIDHANKKPIFELTNKSDLTFCLVDNNSDQAEPVSYILRPRTTIHIHVKDDQKVVYTLSNCHIGMGKNLSIKL